MKETLGNYLYGTGSDKARAVLAEMEGKEFVETYLKFLRFFNPSNDPDMGIDSSIINIIVDQQVKDILDGE